MVPFQLLLGHQNKVVPPDKRTPFQNDTTGATGAVFSRTMTFQQKGTTLVPGTPFFPHKRVGNGALLQDGNLFGGHVALFLARHYFSAPLAQSLYRKYMGK